MMDFGFARNTASIQRQSRASSGAWRWNQRSIYSGTVLWHNTYVQIPYDPSNITFIPLQLLHGCLLVFVRPLHRRLPPIRSPQYHPYHQCGSLCDPQNNLDGAQLRDIPPCCSFSSESAIIEGGYCPSSYFPYHDPSTTPSICNPSQHSAPTALRSVPGTQQYCSSNFYRFRPSRLEHDFLGGSGVFDTHPISEHGCISQIYR